MINISIKQKDIISPIFNSFFPEGGYAFYNKNSFLFNIISLNDKHKRKKNKLSKRIEVTYQDPLPYVKDDLISLVKLIDGNALIQYRYHKGYGTLCEIVYYTKYNGWYRYGRESDGLSVQNYDVNGVLTSEAYKDYKTGQLHNNKGPAYTYLDHDGKYKKNYYLNGVHIGTDLPVGDDAELYLKNYYLL